jgi:hypothetical protein
LKERQEAKQQHIPVPQEPRGFASSSKGDFYRRSDHFERRFFLFKAKVARRDTERGEV